MNDIFFEDLNEIVQSKLIDWEKLKNKKIFITGATGLIGSILVKSIQLYNKLNNGNIVMYLLVRNIEKSKSLFGEDNKINYIVSSIEDYQPRNLDIDYMFHAAAPTKSKFFIDNPVETLTIECIGTKNVLEQAKISNVKSMVYLSSMEMYGTMDCENVTEDVLGYINPLNTRSSYSEGKRICELYSYSYFQEYEVPVKIARIAQTFGAGISKEENRVYKYFADAVLNKQDIILKSEGTTIINYSYTTDTVIGLIYLLLNGKNGEAYNLVGPRTNMTILDSAKWLAQTYGDGKIQVRVEIPKQNAGFAPNNRMILSNQKILDIGWKPHYNLMQGYERLLKYMKKEF